MAKFQTVAEVKETREEGLKTVFNRVDMSVALAALKSTPMKTKRVSGGNSGGKKGIFMTNLEEIIKGAKDNGTVEISMAQIQAMMKTTLSAPLTGADEEAKFNKRVSDAVWGVSSRNKKNDAPLLEAGDSKGVYNIK